MSRRILGCWSIGMGLVLGLGLDTRSARAESPAAPASVTAKQTPTRSGSQLRGAIREALQASQASAVFREASIRHLVALYRELERNTDLRPAQREPLRLALRGRLARLHAGLAKPAKLPTRVQTTLAQQIPLPGMNANMPAGQAVSADHGQELRELIEEVIAPGSWDTLGGPGAIRYWPAGNALIVRQTGEVHEQLAQLLIDLRQ
jgi:hypothetical protein